MTSIVCDTSPLIFLAKLDLLALLARETRLFIPAEVFREATAKPELPDAVYLERLVRGKAVALAGKTAPSLPEDRRSLALGAGEAAALGWALEKKFPVATDDLAALRMATALGLLRFTSPGLILLLREKGCLSTEEAGRKLDDLERFLWVKGDVLERYRRVLKGESPWS